MRSFPFPTLLLGVVITLTLGLLTANTRQPEPAPAPATRLENLTQLRLALPSLAGSGLFCALETIGLDDIQLNLASIPLLDEIASVDALLAGDADIAVTTQFALVQGTQVSDQLVIYSEFAQAESAVMLVSKDPPTTASPDLETLVENPQLVGVRDRSPEMMLLNRLRQGHNMRHLQIRRLATPHLLPALMDDKVDALLLSQQSLRGLRQRTNGLESLSTQEIYPMTLRYLLIGTRANTAQQRAAVAVLLAGLKRASEQLIERPGLHAAACGSRFGRTAQSMLEAWDAMDFRVRLDQSLLVALDDADRMVREQHLDDCGHLGERPPANYFDMLVLAPLRKALPNAIQLLGLQGW